MDCTTDSITSGNTTNDIKSLTKTYTFRQCNAICPSIMSVTVTPSNKSTSHLTSRKY